MYNLHGCKEKLRFQLRAHGVQELRRYDRSMSSLSGKDHRETQNFLLDEAGRISIECIRAKAPFFIMNCINV